MVEAQKSVKFKSNILQEEQHIFQLRTQTGFK